MRFSLVGLSTMILLAASAACNPFELLVGEVPTLEPLGTLPVLPEGFQGWEPAAAAPVGSARTFGRLTIEVKNVIRPANHIADDATFYREPERGIGVRCRRCQGGLRGARRPNLQRLNPRLWLHRRQGHLVSRRDATTGISHGFEAGSVPGGKSRSGYLLFEVARDDEGLVMVFPQGAGFTLESATFWIEE